MPKNLLKIIKVLLAIGFITSIVGLLPTIANRLIIPSLNRLAEPAQRIERKSFSDAKTKYPQYRSLITESRYGIHSLMSPLLNYQYPGIAISKIDLNYPCQSNIPEYNNFSLEVVFLSYWANKTPLHAHNSCGTIEFGKAP